MNRFLAWNGARYILIALVIVISIGGGILRSTWNMGLLHNLVYPVVIGVALAAVGVKYLLQRRSLAAFPSEAWFSTKAQMNAFNEALVGTSWLRKSIGRFHIPSDTTYTTLAFWQKFPLVLLARGQITWDAGRLVFVPFPSKNRYDRRDRNLLDDFGFDLDCSEIVSVEPFEDVVAARSAYSLPWTRVQTTRPTPLDDFLLTVGGRNAYGMDRYREQALKLRRDLQSMIAQSHKQL